MRRSEAQLKEAQRIAHVGSWEWDVASNRVTWTDEMYRIYGIEPSDFDRRYQGFLQRVVPEDRDRTRSVVQEAYRANKPFIYDHRIMRPDGSVRMLHTVGETFTDPSGKVARLAGACWDITDRWRANCERDRLLQRTAFLADSSRLLASLDVEPALAALARLAVPFMGDGCAVDLLTEGEWRRLVVVSRDPSRPFTAELPRAVLSGVAALYSAGESSCMAVPLLARGQLLGALSFVQHGGRTYDDTDLVIGGDLAHRVELAIENAKLYRHAQEALSARDEFLAIAAHEIRGPVTALRLAVQSLPQAPADVAAQLNSIIERENRRLGRLVDELLDVVHLRSGKLRLELEEVDLAAAIRRVVERLAAELARSGSALSITAPARLVGSWDQARVEQVVHNLLANAIRFGLGKPIDLRLDSDDQRATITVRDQGIGIGPEAQQRIFDPFERAVAPRHYGGLGMGLFVVRRILEAMGGSVHVDSHPGAGATFTVELPLTGAT